MSSGYSPLPSMARARGLTFSWAKRRTVACSCANSGDSSKSMPEASPARVRLVPEASAAAGVVDDQVAPAMTGRDRRQLPYGRDRHAVTGTEARLRHR